MKRQAFINVLIAASFLLSMLLSRGPGLIRNCPAAEDGKAIPASGRNERHYTMNAGVRLLLFWIGRDNVGGGRIVWTDEPGGIETLELLIGSDPARAPRKINRWGYIAERVSGSSAELTGVMTQSDEQSIEQADANSRSENKHAFKAIHSRVSGGEAQSSTARMHLSEDFTYKDAKEVLRSIPRSGSPDLTVKIPAGTDPGFLFAVKAMMHESVEKYRGSGKLNNPPPRRYIYNASIYQLSMNSSSLLKNVDVNGRKYQNLIESRFEARNTGTGKTSKFTVAYGTDDPIMEIPVRIVYQPRFWFRAELLLDEGLGGVQKVRGAGKP